ncbi:MAG TPA: hypothetical protein VLX11_09525 [Candidatus Acidoferrales bacterium]|nr:hypothetical protein [Candidatus Acidoferrales bacterium]
MKRITARTALKLVFSFSWFIALALVRDARAGDYYMYRDSKGDLVISNNAPPPGSKIINKETLPEATDQQTSESAIRENNVALDDRIASLEKTIGDLAQNLRYQAEVIDNLQQSHGDTNIAVGVTQAPAIVGSRPYDKSNRPPNFRNNLSRGNPRPVVPMSPSQRGGGRAG